MTIQTRNKNQSREKISGLKEKISKLENQLQDLLLVEKKAKESEQRFRTLFETMVQGVVYQDEKGKIVSANPAAEKILGLTQDQLLGRTSIDPCWHTIHEDGTPLPGEQHPSMVSLQTGKKVVDIIIGVFNPAKKQYKWILVNAIPLFLPGDKKPHQVYTTFNDINELRNAEDAFLQSEQKFRNIVQASPMGILMYKLEEDQLIVIGANPAADKILGVENNQFIGKTIEEAYPSLANSKIAVNYKKVCSTGKSWFGENIEYEDDRIKGVYDVYAFQTAKNMIAVLFLDTTERKKMELALLKSEQKYRNLYNSALVGLYQTRISDGQIIAANKTAAKIFGYDSVKQFKAEFKASEHYANPEDRKKMVKLTEAKGKIERQEIIVTKRDGSVIPVEIGSVAYPEEKIYEGVIIDISERKTAEEKLKESEKRFRTVSQLSSDYAYSYKVNPDFSMEYEWVTGALVKITGYTKEELKEKGGWKSLIYPEDLSIPLAQLNELLAGNTNIVEYRIAAKNGDLRWMRDYAQAEVDNMEKRVVRILGAVQDITGTKKVEIALRESEEKYRLLVENQTDLIIKLDKDGKFLYASDSYCDLFGKKNEELIGKNFDPEVHKDDVELTWRSLESLYDLPNTSHVEHRVLTAKGWKWISWVNKAIFDVNGEMIAILGTGRDITERKQAEEALSESRKMLRLVLDTIPVRVFWKNRKGEYLGCNQLFANDAGLTTTDEIIGKNDFELCWKELAEQYCKDDSEVMETGISKLNFEESETSPDGKQRSVRTSKVPLRDKENNIVGVLGTYEDISEQKSLQEQFQHAQKMEAVGRLAGGIAHDFNNLLTAIKGYSQLLLTDLDPDLPFYQDIEEINKASNRAAQLTHQLLTFSRKQVIQPQIIDVNDTISDMKNMLLRLIGEDIILVTSLNATNSVIKIDPIQIEQIIMNLSVNARDAMPKGGKLTIETQNISYSSKQEEIEKGVYLQLRVTDTGIGMPEEIKQHLFEPFYTTKETGKGTGLGLATVYSIINQSGGTIHVMSEKKKGSTFEILFPLKEGQSEWLQRESSAIESFSGVETILIVEDEAIVCDLAVRILEKFSYNVIAEKLVDDAIKFATNYDKTIHLLITDVVMPKMNGADLAKHLHEILPEMKVLFISGYTDETIIHHGVLNGDVNFLQKPFTPEQLVKNVRRILDQETKTIL